MVLMTSLINKGCLSLTRSKMPFPMTDELTIFRQLGVLVSLIDLENEYRLNKIVLGPVFSLLFYDLLKASKGLSTDELLIQLISYIRNDESLSNYVKVIMEPDNKEELIRFSSYMAIEPAEAAMVAKTQLIRICKAIKAFHDGLSGRFIIKLQSYSAQDLHDSVQGKSVSSEGLLRALNVNCSSPSLAFLQKLEWLTEKIRSADIAWLTAFIKAITGSPSLSLDMQISIKESAQPSPSLGFDIHTCMNSIDFPQSEMAKEDFLTALDVAIFDESFNAI